MNEAKETKNLPTTTKRAWTSPRLISFGDVKSLTQQPPSKEPTAPEGGDPLVLFELLTS
jgi:hypothetical protein